MGHHHHGHVPLTLFSAQQVEDLVLDGDVQRSRRFVSKEQRRLAGQSAGNGHPLAHAAAEFVGKSIDSGCGLGDPDLVEEIERDPLRFLTANTVVFPQVFGDLTADFHHRIQGGHGVLEDHGDI